MTIPDEKYYCELMSDAESFELRWDNEPWFDFWHTHVDWSGHGNKSTNDRQRHLSALFVVFQRVYSQAKEKLSEFQCWCDVGPDSAQDAVYLHTKNPNNDNFPADFSSVNSDCNVPSILQAYVNKEQHKVGVWRHEQEEYFTIVFRSENT